MKKVNWDGLVGHKRIVDLFDLYLANGGVPHSMILCGSFGIGKKMIAMKVAQSLMCKNDGSPCGFCYNCKLWNRNAEDNQYLFLGKDAILIEQIRNLKRDLTRSDLLAGYRVIVIDGVERMSKEAANAILKLMEEPQQKIVFIGVTDNLEKVIDTIVSRSVLVYFDRLSKSESEKIIEKKYHKLPDDFDLRVIMGQPGLYDKFIKNSKEQNIRNVINFWQLYCASSAIKLSFINKISNLVPEKILGLLMFWESCIRDYLLWKNSVGVYRWYNHNEVESVYNRMDIDFSRLMSVLDSINFLRKNISSGLNKKLHLMETLSYR